MLKSRILILEKPSLEALMPRLDLIESSLEGDLNSAIDSSKSLVESICKTILIDHDIKIESDDFAPLVKQTFNFITQEQFTTIQDRNLIKKLVSGIYTYTLAIGELRNKYGYFSHGQDLHRQSLNKCLVELVVDSSDALVCFLMNSQREFTTQRARFIYEDYDEFNKWYDSANELVLSGLTFSASKVLFEQDKNAYKEFLIEFNEMKEKGEIETESIE